LVLQVWGRGPSLRRGSMWFRLPHAAQVLGQEKLSAVHWNSALAYPEMCDPKGLRSPPRADCHSDQFPSGIGLSSTISIKRLSGRAQKSSCAHGSYLPADLGRWRRLHFSFERRRAPVSSRPWLRRSLPLPLLGAILAPDRLVARFAKNCALLLQQVLHQSAWGRLLLLRAASGPRRSTS
jgi:hypothetical protein